MAGFVIVSPIIFNVIPAYNKWLVAVPVISILAINTLFASVSTPLFNMLYAIKKVRMTLYLMAMWATASWLFIPYFATRYGINGAALGYALVGITSIVNIYISHRFVNFSIWRSFGQPLFATVIMVAVLLVVRAFVPVSFVGLGLLVAAGAISYLASILSLVGQSLIQDAKRSFKVILAK